MSRSPAVSQSATPATGRETASRSGMAARFSAAKATSGWSGRSSR